MLYCRKAAAGRSFAFLLVGLSGALGSACSFDDSSGPAEPVLMLDGSFSNDGGPLPDAGAAPDATVTDASATDASADVTATVEAAVDTGAALLDASVPETSLVEEAGLDGALAGDAGDAAVPVDAADETNPEAGHVYTDIGALSFAGFDGTTQTGAWVHLPAAPGGASTTAYSVEVWFRTTVADGNMFEVYDAGGGSDRFLSLNGGTVCFYVFTGTAAEFTQVCSSATYDDGQWHHAAGTLGTNGVNVYVDGILADSSTDTTTSAFSDGSDFRLGMGHQYLSSQIVYFTGDLDEVRLWSVERSASDIAANYAQEIDPATPGLQGYWHLDETGTASTTADATGNGNDGTLMNFTYDPSPWVSPGAF